MAVVGMERLERRRKERWGRRVGLGKCGQVRTDRFWALFKVEEEEEQVHCR